MALSFSYFARPRLLAAGFAAALLCAACPPAQAQVDSREGIALQNQIMELRQEVQALQAAQQNGAAMPAPAPEGGEPMAAPPQYAQPGGQAAGGASDITAQLLERVTALEDKMRAVQGRLDELANQQQRDHDDLAKQIGDLSFKLNGGAAPASSGAAPGGPPAPEGLAAPEGSEAAPPPPAPAAVRRTPEQALKAGNAALARRDYPAADEAAHEVLAKKGPHLGEAQLLLARALAGEHEYKQSSALFLAVFKASPKSPRGAEALLEMANTSQTGGNKKEACAALALFAAEFPHPDAALAGSARSIRKRAACG